MDEAEKRLAGLPPELQEWIQASSDKMIEKQKKFIKWLFFGLLLPITIYLLLQISGFTMETSLIGLILSCMVVLFTVCFFGFASVIGHVSICTDLVEYIVNRHQSGV